MKKTCLIAVCVSATLSAAIAGSGRSVQPSIDLGATVNDQLTAAGASFRLAMAECLGTPGNVGPVVFFLDRGNKQLNLHFVPGDPRRQGRTDITWINDLFDGNTASGLSPAETDAAIRCAMATWEGVQCSTIPLTDRGSGV